MDHETLFTASKWAILKRLERGPASPLELSKVCGTSIANISQQLRLLEMAGLVTSERVSNRDKGKPRVLYQLAGNLSYLIATADNFVEKKIVPLTDRNKVVMRIWFFDDANLRYTIEKAFWKIEPFFDKIAYLGVDTRGNTLTFHVQFKGRGMKLQPFTVTDRNGEKRQVLFTTDKTDNPSEEIMILYSGDTNEQ